MPDNFLDSVDLVTEGYEDPMSEEGDSENFGFFNSDEVQSPEGKTVTGKPMSSHLVTSISSSAFKGAFFGTGDHILGMPFKYTALADPLSRVYQDTFESDNSCIAFIKFGTPRINRLLYQKMSVDSEGTSSYFSKEIGASILLGLRSAIDPAESAQDQRLISFEEDKMPVFMKYACSSLNELWILLDLPGQFSPDTFSEFTSEQGKGFTFYCVKTGAFNEGLTNNYTIPSVVQKMNSDAEEKRQNYQLYGTYGNISKANDGGTATGSWLANIKSGIIEKITEDIANAPIIGSVASTFMTSNKGSMSYYAKIWQDSQPERSYSMSFKFRTAYGNKWDIYRNVFFPFLLLHTAAMPKQDGRFSYQEPFLVKIDFPGWFRVNCGVINNLSWVKGGDNQSWSVDGLPLEMTVTMTVEDLYPIELASENVTVLEYNWGLMSFLENMAGLTYTDVLTLNPYKSKYLNIKNEMALQDGSIGSKLWQYSLGWNKTISGFKKNFVDSEGNPDLATGLKNIAKQKLDSYSYLGASRP